MYISEAAKLAAEQGRLMVRKSIISKSDKVNSIYKCIRRLCISSYVAHGLKDGRADTYYVTNYGISKIGEYEV